MLSRGVLKKQHIDCPFEYLKWRNIPLRHDLLSYHSVAEALSALSAQWQQWCSDSDRERINSLAWDGMGALFSCSYTGDDDAATSKYIHHSGMMLDNGGHFLFGFLSWQLMHLRFWTQKVTFCLNTYHQGDDRRRLKPWPTPRSASWPTPRPGTSGIRNFSPWWEGTALKSLLCLIFIL